MRTMKYYLAIDIGASSGRMAMSKAQALREICTMFSVGARKVVIVKVVN